jgi:DNA-binding IscR family transcriptional regulator
LARAPHLVRLREAYDLFEREDRSNNCPFGGGVCGVGDPCAMHERLRTMQAAIRNLLEDTTFEIFRKAVQEDGLVPVPKGMQPESPRETYRAPHARKKLV